MALDEGSSHVVAVPVAAGKEFRAAVATATARALGARYKPEIAAAVKGLPKKTADGLAIDFAVDSLKVRLCVSTEVGCAGMCRVDAAFCGTHPAAASVTTLVLHDMLPLPLLRPSLPPATTTTPTPGCRGAC